ncbi:hypothetical protein BH23GEM8_BH23GEM8_08520 [soil metagenome]
MDALLKERYRHLRLFDGRPWIAPVKPKDVHTLYRLFLGNLRGTLHALNTAAKQLIGRGENPTAPMTMERMRPILHGIYGQKLTTDLTSAEIEYLRKMTESAGPNTDVIQKEAQESFGLSSSAVSELFISLRTKGYLAETIPRSTGRPGRPSLRYKLPARPDSHSGCSPPRKKTNPIQMDREDRTVADGDASITICAVVPTPLGCGKPACRAHHDWHRTTICCGPWSEGSIPLVR